MMFEESDLIQSRSLVATMEKLPPVLKCRAELEVRFLKDSRSPLVAAEEYCVQLWSIWLSFFSAAAVDQPKLVEQVSELLLVVALEQTVDKIAEHLSPSFSFNRTYRKLRRRVKGKLIGRKVDAWTAVLDKGTPLAKHWESLRPFFGVRRGRQDIEVSDDRSSPDDLDESISTQRQVQHRTEIGPSEEKKDRTVEVEAFLARVKELSPGAATKKAFNTVAGYNDRTQFQRWQSGKLSAGAAADAFERVLKMDPREFAEKYLLLKTKKS